jgi:hypothetical protein
MQEWNTGQGKPWDVHHDHRMTSPTLLFLSYIGLRNEKLKGLIED